MHTARTNSYKKVSLFLNIICMQCLISYNNRYNTMEWGVKEIRIGVIAFYKCGKKTEVQLPS